VSSVDTAANPTGHHLDVPGARLYYEVRGAGPTLLLIGAPMGVDGFAAMADELADSYTVVSYDPRGISRSPVGNGSPEQDTPQLRAEDIHHLLNALASGPAHVFGSSGGALTGLALLTTYPEQVQTLIVHEPPLVSMLPDHAELVTASRRSGVSTAARARAQPCCGSSPSPACSTL
jgi:pimeloyl-ACP methyl ester carboxylesterase